MEVTNEKEYVNTIDYNRVVVGSHSFCLHTKYGSDPNIWSTFYIIFLLISSNSTGVK